MPVKWVQTLRFSQRLFQKRPLSTMAPLANMSAAAYVNKMIETHNIMVFSKSFCPFCHKVKDVFKQLDEPFEKLELDLLEGDWSVQIQEALTEKTNQRTVPNVFIKQRHIGGCDAVLAANETGLLKEILKGPTYDYDLVIIGGGSGGMAASKEASRHGMKVVLLDFVKPTPHNVTWGLGGTCVNVGCIPKKLMHKAALMGEDFKDAPYFGWKLQEAEHDWHRMIHEIQDYIKSLNFNYRSQLTQKGVTYMNAFAEFVESNKLKTTDRKGNVKMITARNFIIAVGGRPKYLNIPGAKEYCITSDDLFSLSYHPKKTLLIGASYIALECAGFLAGIGADCTVMARSILLRGFDQQMANMIGSHMEKHNVKFIRECVPTKIEQIAKGKPGKLKVTARNNCGEEIVNTYNTVIFAVGREACTANMGLDKIGVKMNPKNMKIIANEYEQSSLPHIYAIGDVLDGKPELTPVAIQTGKALAQRLCKKSNLLTDYTNVPTTVFTPLEYGCVGLSEEHAIAKYGEDNIEVYHTHFQPLEYELSKRDINSPELLKTLKTYVNYSGKNLNISLEKVVGFHVLSPNAGEITQGYAIGLKMGATKNDFASLIGIHPTCAEWFTVMDITKASGQDVQKTSC